MRKLQKVNLSGMQEVITMSSFGDEEFFKFASAWPAIEELDLPATQMTATIRTLQSFATECPRLRHLRISFDGQAVEDSTLPMTSSPLEMLMVGETPIPMTRYILLGISTGFSHHSRQSVAVLRHS
jgi:hypothetical protein